VTNENEPVDIDMSKATKVEAGEPVEAVAVSQLGSTFAERAAARAKADAKAVKSDDAEDKSVTSAGTKSRRTSKKA